MAQAIDWHGTNKTLGKPQSLDDLQCSSLRVFSNGVCCVSAWELSDDELAEINRTRQVFLSVWFGPTSPPVFVGSETTVREVTADNGTWKRRD